jgi:hypothetical protein
VSRWQREIATLDPERDAQRIVFIDASLEFPWDTLRAHRYEFEQLGPAETARR